MKRCITYNIPVYKSYGMTETSSGICGFWLHEHPSKYQSVGCPFMKIKLNIVNSVLQVSGSTVMSGYFGEKPIKDWLDTGDCGKIDNEGFIYIDLRQDNRIITGGENVNPKEVEEILLSHPQITAAKVYGEHDEDFGQIVVAEISSELQTGELNSWLKGKISNFKIPKVFYN
jgi:O-succinylbenzoic acid--CoA ligase